MWPGENEMFEDGSTHPLFGDSALTVLCPFIVVFVAVNGEDYSFCDFYFQALYL